LHLVEELRRYADELRRTKGLSFSVRMGLNSGDVVVGKIGDDLRMDYTAQGHTVGIAARVEEVCAPDRVYLADATASLVTGYFQLLDLGEFDLKGVREPVRVHELQGIGQLRSRLDLSRARGFSRFVGRVEEMRLLETALERAEKGNPQIIGIVGEPGVGKSRLCFEFLQHCRARGIMTYETTGVAHGKAIPLLPILKLFRAFFGITEQDSDVTARERIAGRLLLLGEQFRDVLPVMFDFMGVPDPENPAPNMDPEARQRQIVSVIKGVTQARAGLETSVALLEDLHWFDSASEAYVDPLLDAPPGSRSLVIVNFRPEYHADWTQRPQYQQVPLVPLGPEAISELLADLLGSDPSLAGLPELIRERTGGNPFFTEEVVNSLVESGHLEESRGSYRLAIRIEEIAVPSTVQAVLAARIDRLAEREKQVLQTAAVIGKTFAEPVLERAGKLPKQELATALHELKSGDFIYETALYPVAEYVFKHPLTQEVALGSQLKERRARVHAAVAQTIEALNPDKLDEQAAELAYHWEEAGDALEAARWHRRAAEWVGSSNFEEASGHWRRVLTLLDTIEDSPEATQLGLDARRRILILAVRRGLPEAEAARIYREGKELAERAGDLRSLSLIERAYGEVRIGTGLPAQDFVEVTQEAVRLADESDDLEVRVVARQGASYAHWVAGRLSDGLALCEEVALLGERDLRLGVDMWGYSMCIWFQVMRPWILICLGRYSEVPADVNRGAQLARDHDEPEVLGWIHDTYSRVAEMRGDGRSALAHAQQALELAERIGSPQSQVFAYSCLGHAHLLNESWGDAAEFLEHALAVAREKRTFLAWEAWYLSGLAEARRGNGDDDRALATAREAVAAGERHGTRYWAIPAHLALARALLSAEGEEAKTEIEGALETAAALVDETEGRSYQPFIPLVRAEVALAAGDRAGRDRELRRAHRLFLEMGANGHAERIERELAR
jgi:adenylate cyclase